MVMSLLTTKLYVPTPRPNLLSRPRLIKRLGEGLHLGHRLTLISAPAGFGKTTLLCEWAASCGQPVAWLSLDERDNDPARFFAYFVAALRTIETSVADEILGALQSPQPPALEELLTSLINQINTMSPMSKTLSCPFVLILDDYHLITTHSIHEALQFLLDHLPPQIHLVIATRADPPLPITRLRSRGQLTELRQTDLRFTHDEAAEFLCQVAGLELSTDDVSTLASRTEGWITGLQMAAASMQGRNDISSFIRNFTGSNRYILDYLIEEVIQRQPDSVQTFLLQTSILDRLTSPLCDAITNQNGSQLILEMLERNNLFISPLDDERCWYRYHRLFADLLRKRLYQLQADQAPILHRRASMWYEQHGQMAAAIEHALAAGDFERALPLIEQTAEATLMRSEIVTFLNWVEALPDELVQAHPSLNLFHAWVLLLTGHPLDAAEKRLQDISGSTDLIPGRVSLLHALIATYQGNISRAADLSRQALEQLPEEDQFLRHVASWNLSISRTARGDLVAGRQALNEVARKSQESGNIMVAGAALRHLARLRMREGQLHKAEIIYQQMLDLATDGQGRRLPIAADALMGLGELSREWNDLKAATHYLTQGIELTKRGRTLAAITGYLSLTRVKQAQGDDETALDTIQKAQQLAIESDATEMDDLIVALFQARLWVAQGNHKAAIRWAKERGLLWSMDTTVAGEAEGLKNEIATAGLEERDGLVDNHLQKYEHLVLARLLIAQNQPKKALALLESLLSRIKRQGRTDLEIEIQILRALALVTQRDPAPAITALEHALSLAEPGGYVRIFVDEGEPMAELLRKISAKRISAEYVNRLLAAFEGEAKGQRTKMEDSSSVLAPSPLVEPLSDRELEVLRLLTTSLSTPEIAQELIISVNTVRSHVKSIYSKLDVHGRTDAIHRAQELKLL